jgi:hypothetical protein
MTAPIYIAYYTDEHGPGHRVFTQRPLAEDWLKEHPLKDARIVERQAVADAVSHLAQKERKP